MTKKLSHNSKYKIGTCSARGKEVKKSSFKMYAMFKDEEVIILPTGYFLQTYIRRSTLA